jgi:hypothetical protein
MGSVVSFSDDVRLDQAWESLREHNMRLLCNPGLIVDRAFVEEHIRRQDHYTRLLRVVGK